MARRRKRRGKTPRPNSWERMAEQAKRQLDANRRAIEDSGPQGTPSDRPSDWRIGKPTAKDRGRY